MLTTYQTRTRQLLQNPSAPVQLYSDPDINSWINIARGQVAGEGECVRFLGALTMVQGQRNYDFSAINVGVAATTGRQGVLKVNSILYSTGAGYLPIYAKSWPWFSQFHLANPAPGQAAPEIWSQYGQGGAGTGTGSAASGSIYFDPPPDFGYTLLLDCVCYPIALVDDSTIEAIPFPWTDAVPFFAAYFALLSSQLGARQADAGRIYGAYQEFMSRARRFSNPEQQGPIYSQAQDPTLMSKLGMKPQAGGG